LLSSANKTELNFNNNEENTMTHPTAPIGKPGDILNWPMLKISYLTDPENIAALLPPGIAPAKNPKVTLTIYNFPVLNEPEYGCVVNVDAVYNGIEGEYTLGIAIDQEAAIYGSHERWGQPK
jgi:acetoacetate decarboxylase